jgi:hypothetical protein
VFHLSTNSLSQQYFTARSSSEHGLWQLADADRGNCSEIAHMQAADYKSLHLLPFDYCGKITVTTPFMDVCQLKK